MNQNRGNSCISSRKLGTGYHDKGSHNMSTVVPIRLLAYSFVFTRPCLQNNCLTESCIVNNFFSWPNNVRNCPCFSNVRFPDRRLYVLPLRAIDRVPLAITAGITLPIALTNRLVFQESEITSRCIVSGRASTSPPHDNSILSSNFDGFLFSLTRVAS